jgi:hypothetical protein
MKRRYKNIVLSLTLITAGTTTVDASTFGLMFETDANAGPGDELAFLTYDSLPDILAANPTSSTFSQIDVNGPFSTTGLTWDGSQFVLMFETDVNAGPGAELAFLTYASLPDILAANPTSSTFSQIDVNGPFSTTGLYYMPSPDAHVVPLPASAWLFAAGLLTLGATMRRRDFEQT